MNPPVPKKREKSYQLSPRPNMVNCSPHSSSRKITLPRKLVVEPSSNEYIYKTSPAPKSQTTLKKGKKLVQAEHREVQWKTVPPRNVRSYTHSHQHACLNMSSTRTTDMSRWTRKSPQGLNAIQRTTGKECWESEKQSSPGKNTPISSRISNGQLWKQAYKLHYTDWAGYI